LKVEEEKPSSGKDGESGETNKEKTKKRKTSHERIPNQAIRTQSPSSNQAILKQTIRVVPLTTRSPEKTS
jgi:hypothetical protein